MAKSRRRSQSPARPRGRVPWARGGRLDFLKSLLPDYKVIASAEHAPFYRLATRGFIQCFGWHHNINGDESTPVSTYDPQADDFPSLSTDGLSAEEVKRRESYHTLVYGKIGDWLRDQVRKVKKDVTIGDLFEHASPDLKAPARVAPWQFYSRLHYDERVKPQFNKRMADEQAKWSRKLAAWEELGVDVPADEKPPCNVSLRAEVTRACWEAEEEVFRKIVIDTQEHNYQQHMAAFKKQVDATGMSTAPMTPEEFQARLDNAPIYLEATANAYLKGMGWACSILLTGPVPNKGGKIGALSIHAGETAGVSNLIWPQVDPDGFARTIQGYVGFGEKVFPDHVRAMRALPGTLLLPSAPIEVKIISAASATSSQLTSSARPLPASPTRARSRSPTFSRRLPYGVLPGSTSASSQPSVDGEQTPTPAQQVPRQGLEQSASNADESHLASQVQPGPPSVELSAGSLPPPSVELSAGSLPPPSAATLSPSCTALPLHLPAPPLTQAPPPTRSSSTPVMQSSSPHSARAPSPHSTRTPSLQRAESRESSTAPLPSPTAPTMDCHSSPTRSSLGNTSPLAMFSSSSTTTQVPNDITAPGRGLSLDALGPRTEPSTGPAAATVAASASTPAPSASSVAAAAVASASLETTMLSEIAADVQAGAAHQVWSMQSSARRWPHHVAGLWEAAQRGKQWGMEYAQALESMLEFEYLLDYPLAAVDDRISGPRSGPKLRPAVVPASDRGIRSYKRPATISNIREFFHTYKKWWISIQPTARFKGGEFSHAASVVTKSKDWEGLDACGGRNGLFLVFMALTWWGDHVNANDGRLTDCFEWSDWEWALNEFRETMDSMMATGRFKKLAALRRRERTTERDMSTTSTTNSVRETRTTKRKAEAAIDKGAVKKTRRSGRA